MANTYIVNYSDSTKSAITVSPGEINGPGGINRSTDLVLLGQNRINYGEYWNENFLHVLENFAHDAVSAFTPDPNVILKPVVGQLWFNTIDDTLNVYNGNNWNLISGGGGDSNTDPVAPSVQPGSPEVGSLYYDTVLQQLKIYNGSTFVSVAERYFLKTGGTITGAMNLQGNLNVSNGGNIVMSDDSNGGTVITNFKFATSVVSTGEQTTTGNSSAVATMIKKYQNIRYGVSSAASNLNAGKFPLDQNNDSYLVGTTRTFTFENNVSIVPGTNFTVVGGATITTSLLDSATFLAEGVRGSSIAWRMTSYQKANGFALNDEVGGGGGGTTLNLIVEETDGSPTVQNVSKIRLSNITVVNNGGGIVTLTAPTPATPAATITAKQNSAVVSTTATSLNFTGAGVAVSTTGGGSEVTINIPGGGGGTTGITQTQADGWYINATGDTMTGPLIINNTNINLNNNSKVINSSAPVDPTDLTTKSYVDGLIAGVNSSSTLTNYYNKTDGDARYILKTGGTMTGQLVLTGQPLNVSTQKIINLGTPTAGTDATNKTYVDNAITAGTGAFTTQIAGKVSKTGDTMSGVLNMGSNKITNVSTPTANTDAANKAYVDSVASGGGKLIATHVHNGTGTAANTYIVSTQTLNVDTKYIIIKAWSGGGGGGGVSQITGAGSGPVAKAAPGGASGQYIELRYDTTGYATTGSLSITHGGGGAGGGNGSGPINGQNGANVTVTHQPTGTTNVQIFALPGGNGGATDTQAYAKFGYGTRAGNLSSNNAITTVAGSIVLERHIGFDGEGGIVMPGYPSASTVTARGGHGGGPGGGYGGISTTGGPTNNPGVFGDIYSPGAGGGGAVTVNGQTFPTSAGGNGSGTRVIIEEYN